MPQTRTKYRIRVLSTTYQLACPSVEDDTVPMYGPDNKPVVDFGGRKFARVAGNDSQFRKRLLPLPSGYDFFTALALEYWAANAAIDPTLGEPSPAELKDVTEMKIAEYAEAFGRAKGSGGESLTYMPRREDGTPDVEEFTLIVPRALCINEGTQAGGSKVSGRQVKAAPGTKPTVGGASIFDRVKAKRAEAAAAAAAEAAAVPSGS